MIDIIWNKLPKYIRWPILVGFFLFVMPVKVYEGAKHFVQSEVYAVILPMKEVRDLEMKQFKEDIGTIKQDTRDIRNYLMGHKK